MFALPSVSTAPILIKAHLIIDSPTPYFGCHHEPSTKRSTYSSDLQPAGMSLSSVLRRVPRNALQNIYTGGLYKIGLHPPLNVRVLAPRCIHSSSPHRAGFFMTPIVRGAVAVGARLTRRWWNKLTPERRAAIKQSITKRRSYLFGGVGVLTLYGVYYYTSHLEYTPITGRRRFMMFSRHDLVDLVEQEKEELLVLVSDGHKPLPNTHPHYRKVLSIVTNIISSNWSEDFAGLDWTLYVIDNPSVINAVCLPGGEIFVFTGLLEACHNDDELAFIMSHEIAHAVLGHGAEGLSNRGVVEFFTLFVLAALWAVVPSDLVAYFLHGFSRNTAHILFDYPYSRLIESEADSVGLMFAAKACFNPTKAASVWKHLPEHEGAVEYLSTHPSNESRYDNLSVLLPSAHAVWEDGECGETRVEANKFQTAVSNALKKVFRF